MAWEGMACGGLRPDPLEGSVEQEDHMTSVTFAARERMDRQRLRVIVSNWDALPLPERSCASWSVGDCVFVPHVVVRRYLNAADGDA